MKTNFIKKLFKTLITFTLLMVIGIGMVFETDASVGTRGNECMLQSTTKENDIYQINPYVSVDVSGLDFDRDDTKEAYHVKIQGEIITTEVDDDYTNSQEKLDGSHVSLSFVPTYFNNDDDLNNGIDDITNNKLSFESYGDYPESESYIILNEGQSDEIIIYNDFSNKYNKYDLHKGVNTYEIYGYILYENINTNVMYYYPELEFFNSVINEDDWYYEVYISMSSYAIKNPLYEREMPETITPTLPTIEQPVEPNENNSLVWIILGVSIVLIITIASAIAIIFYKRK